MTKKKIHPNVNGVAGTTTSPPEPAAHSSSPNENSNTVLTVWRKSLLFNGNGFTVFDAAGDLFFRVESYSKSGRTAAEVVLMDASGKPLRTVRRKVVYSGEGTSDRLFSVKKKLGLRLVGNSKTIAYVTPASGGRHVVEGSYAERGCVVYDEKRRKVIEVRRKEAAAGGVAFGDDVFRLVVAAPADGGGLDVASAMALVISLDRMF